MAKIAPRFLIAGGGTGGHFFSGIAVAEELRRRFPESSVLFVGTRYGLEKDIVPRANFPIEFIAVSPLKGSGWKARLKGLAQLPKSYLQSKKILKKFHPDIVIGIGGYASGPMTLAAHRKKIPTAIIEQNSIPGFTNRQLGRFVDRIFIAFDKAKEYFPAGKISFTGNPSRCFAVTPGNQNENSFCLFILGGSQGAHALNAAMIEALPALQKWNSRLRLIHQTGSQDFEEVKHSYEKAGFKGEVFPFSQDLGSYYSQADLLLCRAGAGTITELQNLGKPALLVPYPFAADDHQLYNAKEMVEAGAAEMIFNRDLNGKLIAEKIDFFLAHPKRLHEMGLQAKKLGKPNAAAQALEICLELIKSRHP